MKHTGLCSKCTLMKYYRNPITDKQIDCHVYKGLCKDCGKRKIIWKPVESGRRMTNALRK